MAHLVRTGWTCPECSRTFARQHQWHSCIELSLETALATASDHAVSLYRAFEDTMRTCGPFRIHPQKTRIAFINTMTFASARLARRWIDVMLITAEPIDDRRIRTLECYGPTTFTNGVRIAEIDDLDAAFRRWACDSLRRGSQETHEPAAHVEALVGRPLELVVVPLRGEVVDADGVLVVRIPRYAADVFQAHPSVGVRLIGHDVRGLVEAGDDRWWVRLPPQTLESLGLGAGDGVDVTLRADL